ncbi:MAG: hypothetical protein M5U33_12445 [Pseudorhodoplanes sp.]|nr:hypothetical protein [Pseudorhodoplanes sp.]
MTGQNRLNLGGIDVLAAGHDHVLDAVLDENEAVLVYVAGVARMEPAVADGVGGGFGARPVAGHQAFALIADFADLAGRQFPAFGIDDPGAPAEHRPAAGQELLSVMMFERQGGEGTRGLRSGRRSG